VRIEARPFRGQVPRDDVAAVLDALLQTERAARLILYVSGGVQTIEEALASCFGHADAGRSEAR
jgi:hypothetical protein